MTQGLIHLANDTESMKAGNTSKNIRSIQRLKPQKTDRRYIARGPAGVVQHVLIAGPCRPLRVLFIIGTSALLFVY